MLLYRFHPSNILLSAYLFLGKSGSTMAILIKLPARITEMNHYYLLFSALAMQIDKHSVGYISYHGGIRSLFSTQLIRDTGNIISDSCKENVE